MFSTFRTNKEIDNTKKNKIVNINSKSSYKENTEQKSILPIPPISRKIKYSDLSETEITDKLNFHKFLILLIIKIRDYFTKSNLHFDCMKYYYIDMLDLLKMKNKTYNELFVVIDEIIKKLLYNYNNKIEEVIYYMYNILEKCKDINILKIFYEAHNIDNFACNIQK